MGFFKSGLVFLGLAIALSVTNNVNQDQIQNIVESIILENQANTDEFPRSLSKEDIYRLTEKVMNHLVQKTDENYRVLEYDNKKDLIDSFLKYTSLSLAKMMVDLYYNEHDGQLYIIPTETPPWLTKDNPFQVIQSSPTQIKVVQDNQSELYGDYRIEMEFVYNSEQGWILNDVNYP